MAMKRYLRNALSSVLKSYGYDIVDSRSLYDWQKHPGLWSSQPKSRLPEGAEDYLCANNPVLKDLQHRYSAFNKAVTTPLVWTDAHVSPDDMLYFRGDNAYVWQLRGASMNVLVYALTAYYVKAIDKLGLMRLLKEDDAFGSLSFIIDGKPASRDLLDSIIEIYFLEKHLNISTSVDIKMLDIGAGYGRLAHRMVIALPNIGEYLCTDAYAASSFLADYYLRYRELDGKAKVVPLDEIESVLKKNKVDIAINIHSFSECRLPAIEWWLSLISKYKVRYLMIAPNSGEDGGNSLRTNDGLAFDNIVEKHGYELIAKDPKYGDPVVQKYGIHPTYHFLFQLSPGAPELPNRR